MCMLSRELIHTNFWKLYHPNDAAQPQALTGVPQPKLKHIPRYSRAELDGIREACRLASDALKFGLG